MKRNIRFRRPKKQNISVLEEVGVITTNTGNNIINNNNDNINNDEDNVCAVKKRIFMNEKFKRLSQSQLIELMLIFSLACSFTPAFDKSTDFSQKTSPLLSQFFLSESHIALLPPSYVCNNFEEVRVTFKLWRDLFVEQNSRYAAVRWSAPLLDKVTDGHRYEDDDDDDDEDNKKDNDNNNHDDGDSKNDMNCGGGDGVICANYGEPARGPQTKPLDWEDVVARREGDGRSTQSGSSIGGSVSSARLLCDSDAASTVSTPRKAPSFATAVITVCDDYRNFTSSGRTYEREEAGEWGFQHLPESVLLAIISCFTFPDVLAFLRTNKRFNELVKKRFAMNEHGAFIIPAFTGRSTHFYRQEIHSSGKNKSNKKDCSSDVEQLVTSQQKSIRLFFGQQRRDNHSSSLRHLLSFLVPEMTIPHIEAHTNVHKGRGKGCSWVFVTSQKDAERLMGFDKLIFLDINEKKEEVYILAPPRSREWLRKYAEEVGNSLNRPINLPRQPIVVELPERSLAKNNKAILRPQIKPKNKREQRNHQQNIQEQKKQEEKEKEKEKENLICEESYGEKEEEQKNITTCVAEVTPVTNESNSELKKKITTHEQKKMKYSFLTDRSPNFKTSQSKKKHKYNSHISSFYSNNVTYHKRKLFCNDFSERCFEFFNVNATTIMIGNSQYRHDPYIYNPLCQSMENVVFNNINYWQ